MYRFDLNGIKADYLDCLGRVCFKVADFRNGSNYLKWKVGQTAIQRIFNIVTIFFMMIWIIMLIYFFQKYRHDKITIKRRSKL